MKLGTLNLPMFPKNENEVLKFRGLLMLDYFAGQALTGIISQRSEASLTLTEPEIMNVSRQSYVIAEEMLRARENWQERLHYRIAHAMRESGQSMSDTLEI